MKAVQLKKKVQYIAGIRKKKIRKEQLEEESAMTKRNNDAEKKKKLFDYTHSTFLKRQVLSNYVANFTCFI